MALLGDVGPIRRWENYRNLIGRGFQRWQDVLWPHQSNSKVHSLLGTCYPAASSNGPSEAHHPEALCRCVLVLSLRRLTNSKGRTECAGNPAHASKQSAWLARGLVLAHGPHSAPISPCPRRAQSLPSSQLDISDNQAGCARSTLRQARRVMHLSQSCEVLACQG